MGLGRPSIWPGKSRLNPSRENQAVSTVRSEGQRAAYTASSRRSGSAASRKSRPAQQPAGKRDVDRLTLVGRLAIGFLRNAYAQGPRADS
jgi:hypothetical protein